MAKRILLGHIASAHGIRGEVLIKSYTGVPEDIGTYGILTDEPGTRTFKIASARATPKGVIARIEGVQDRTAAEALRGTALTVAREALPEPDETEFYHTDLIGLDAVAPDGTAIGHVLTVQNFGAGDLLEIRLAGRKDTEYVPFTDTYVPTVDIPGGRVTVILPEMIGDQAEEAASGDDSTE